MLPPAQSRERKLKKAREVREFLDALSPVRDIEARAKISHDRVTESVREICAGENPPFTEPQIEVLAEIAAQVAFLNDPSLSMPKGLWARGKAEYSKLGVLEKIAVWGGLIAMAIGVVQLGQFAVQSGDWAIRQFQSRPTEAQAMQGDAVPGTSGKLNLPKSGDPSSS